MNGNWTGFSKKSPAERLQLLKESGLLQQEYWQPLAEQRTLPLETANQMSENVLATLALPYSLVPDFLVDGRCYQVPFVTEEPSVVAAASFAAKIIKRSGGFETEVHKRQMIGQIALYQIEDADLAAQSVLQKKADLLARADQAYPSIVARGGGARDLWLEQKDDFLIFYLSVDTQEAMGANMLNTMLESLTLPLEELTGGKSLMAILSNYATDSLVTARCVIDYRFLSRDRAEAALLADKMQLASKLAQADPYRAATHNKGIFNGIDAVVLATGNDWRAVEAGAHAYASREGSYRGLSAWTADPDKRQLHGQLTLPMPVATKGGSIGLNPAVAASLDLLGQPRAKELAALIVSVGLAQNFAAIKALVSTGIQAGHMKLQAKSLALQAGAKEEEIPALVSHLTATKNFNLATAQEILADLRKQNQ
ncbi:hydroxymethylglutaryl-CoA reductase, degradative [Streptococcus panodentis]|uniref:3-hydroxy-3-methylglutaryl coenzyme A reductase n=1 Tax=Streptococcus panodentis TaxID=1581472 RepID=A0ABS5AWI9_9STRE|nr:hydroxymethylglutaryl-CoA reductase, degradative [Streptococcus panodentis]MBP2620613.1 hydroxymethylglutaryl-CoA reductase, degradative [Streptococcus panodentis]